MRIPHAARNHPGIGSSDTEVPLWPAVLIVVLAVLPLPKGVSYGLSVYLLFLAAITWAASGEKMERSLLRVVLPFGLVIVIGLLGGIGADRYLYLKDAWWVSNAAVSVCLGYVLYRCMPELARGLKAFVIAGTLLGLLHLAQFALHPELLSMNAGAIRERIGFGPIPSALAFTILCAYFGRWSEHLKMPRWIALACLAICLAAVISSFSRQLLMLSVIGALAAAGVFARREWLRFGLIALVLGMSLALLRLSVDIDTGKFQDSFLGKLARIPEELGIGDYSDRASIVANYRGYETSRALETYTSGTPVQVLLGQGFGKQLDLDLFIALGWGDTGERERIHFAPILHNGYAYLLFKAGPISLVMVAYALAWLYVTGRRKAGGGPNQPLRAPGRILQAVALSLAFYTWVSMGVFAGGPYMLVAGFLLGALSRSSVSRMHS